MVILEVIPITKSIRSGSLSYFSAKDVSLGTLVSVPLRKQEILAVVIGKEPVHNLKMTVRSAGYQLKNIHEAHQEQIFSAAFLNMARDIGNYYVKPTGVILDTLLPSVITKDIKHFARPKVGVEKQTESSVSILQRARDERLVFYRTRAREMLANGMSLYIVCPTIEECQQVYEKVSRGIESHCYLFHGSLTAKKIREGYKHLITKNTPAIIIGTPGCAALAPDTCSEYIIESSSSSSYETVTAPHIDMRLCIETLVKHAGGHVVYADSVIGIDLWYRVREREVDVIEPVSKRVLQPTRIHVFSFNKEMSESERISELMHTKGGFHPLHGGVLKQLETSIKKEEKIVVFVSKKGMAPNMVCTDCGNVAVSPDSGAPYSLYTQKSKEIGKQENIYICNATGERVRAFDRCQFCNGFTLKKMGIATSGVAELLSEKFPDVPVVVIDGQHTKTKRAVTEARKKAEADGPVIFVTTSKVLSVLDGWDTSVVISLAPLLSRMSYRNEEDVLYILAKLQERTKRMLIIQNRGEVSGILPVIENGMYQSFVDEQMSLRKQFSYPPYVALLEIAVTTPKGQLRETFDYWSKKLSLFDPDIMVRPYSRTQVKLLCIVKLRHTQWSRKNQEARLFELLAAQDRNVEVYVNPRSLG